MTLMLLVTAAAIRLRQREMVEIEAETWLLLVHSCSLWLA
jgi:hypothetical protein